MKHSQYINRLYTSLCLLFVIGALPLQAQQGFYITGSTQIKLGSKDTLSIKGDLVNKNNAAYITLHNTGHIFLTGNLVDSARGLFQSSSYANSETATIDSTALPKPDNKIPLGHLHFIGKQPQHIYSNLDTAIWFANLHILNAVQLNNSIRVLGTLYLYDSLDLHGHDIYHYIYEDFNYTGNWGRLANETETSFIYDSDINRIGAIKMWKKNGATNGFADLKTIGIQINSLNSNAKILLARKHKRDMRVTSGTISKYYDILRQDSLRKSDVLSLTYLGRDFNPGQQSEADFSLWEIRTDNYAPTARRIQSLRTGTKTLISQDTIGYEVGKRYSLATTRCSDAPYIHLGADTVLCAGNTLTLNAPVNRHLPAHYQWWHIENDSLLKQGENDSTLYLQEAGTYYLRVVDNRGCESFDTIRVSLAPKPKPYIFVDGQKKCETTPFLFSYIDSASVPLSGIQWDFGDQTTATDSLFSKSYAALCKEYPVTLTATSAQGCKATACRTVTVEQRKQPWLDVLSKHDTLLSFQAKDSLNSCSQNMSFVTWYVNQDSVASTDQGEEMYYRFPSFGTYTISVRMQGEFCTAYTHDTLNIQDKGIPFFQLSKKHYCVGEQVHIENQSVENDGPFNYHWDYSHSPSSSGKDPMGLSYSFPGTYHITLTMSASGGWRRVYTDSLTIHPNPRLNLGDSIYYCKPTYTLKPEETNADYTYSWQKDGQVLGTQDSYLAAANGLYTLVVTHQTYACQSTESVVLSLNNPLRPQLGSDREVCGSLTLDAHNPNANYLWNTGATSRTLSLTTSGTYSVRVWDTAGCEGFDTLQVVIHENPNAELGNDISVCSNETLELQTPQNASGATYLWSTGASTPHILISAKGQYTVEVTHANGLCKASDTVFISEKEAPAIQWEGDSYICNGQSTHLNQQDQYYAELIRWTFPNGDTTSGTQISTKEPGVHYLYVRYTNGCSANDSILVRKMETHAVANFMLSSRIERNDSLQLVNLSYPEPLSYEWKLDNVLFSKEENPMLVCHEGASWMQKDTTDILLTVTDGSCAVSKLKQIIVESNRITKVFDPSTGEEIWIGDSLNNTNYIGILDAVIYPNPSNGKFILDLKLSSESAVLYVITDAQGNLITRHLIEATPEQKLEFNLSPYPNGVYLLYLGVGSKSKVLKILNYK